MRCPACDTPNPPDAVRCEECGEKLPARTGRSPSGQEGIVEVRPVGKRPDTAHEDSDEDRAFESRPRRRRVRRREEDEDYADDGGLATLIPYKNPKALAGYYVGFFSLIPGIGLILAPVAIVLSILGIRHSNRYPESKGLVHAIVGLILAILAILCVNPLLVFLIYKQFRAGPAF
jgi:hypothetical protein